MSTPSQVLVIVITRKGVESRRGVPKRDIERTGNYHYLTSEYLRVFRVFDLYGKDVLQTTNIIRTDHPFHGSENYSGGILLPMKSLVFERKVPMGGTKVVQGHSCTTLVFHVYFLRKYLCPYI